MANYYWFKNNKAAQKYPREKVLEVFHFGLEFLKDKDNKAILLIEVWDAIEDKFEICDETVKKWIRRTYLNDEEIQAIVRKIKRIVEIRVVKDQEVLRTNVQNLVLQNRHDYAERQEQKILAEVSQAPLLDVKSMAPEEISEAINKKLQDDNVIKKLK